MLNHTTLMYVGYDFLNNINEISTTFDFVNQYFVFIQFSIKLLILYKNMFLNIFKCKYELLFGIGIAQTVGWLNFELDVWDSIPSSGKYFYLVHSIYPTSYSTGAGNSSLEIKWWGYRGIKLFIHLHLVCRLLMSDSIHLTHTFSWCCA
jgi:hypothetical protein